MNRIKLCDRYKCTQCMACVNMCPKGAITMADEGEGFFIPHINQESCTECGACMRVCHRIEPRTQYHTPLHTLACWTKNNEDRKRSSSGGAFSVLARMVLDMGGVVFGATMDRHLQVKHICIDRVEDIYLLQGSKYVQSYLGETFKKVREYLSAGRKVLFTGTPCQVGGLLAFLRKKYDNLITCDMVCHGVPSQRAFNAFCERTNLSGTCDVVSFRFTEGWGFQLGRGVKKAAEGDTNSIYVKRKPICPSKAWYMRAFNKSLMFNEACYTCAYTTPQRISDYTMADYWGLGAKEPFSHSTFRGVSMLLVNTENAWNMIQGGGKDLFYEERTLDEAIEGNYNLSNCSKRPLGRDTFIQDMQRMNIPDLLKKYGIQANARDYLRLLKQWINSKRV